MNELSHNPMSSITQPKQAKPEMEPWFVILKLIAGIAVISYLAKFEDLDGTGRSIMLWALLALPLAWITVCPQRGAAIAVGTAIGTVIINLPMLLLLVLVFKLPSPRIGYDIIYPIMQIPLLVAAIAAWIKNSSAKAKIVLPVAVATLLYYHGVDISPLSTKTADSPDTMYIVRTVDKCAIRYAGQHQGHYPDGLQELGPNGSGCLPEDIARGRSDGIKLTYLPRGTGFGVLADSHSFWRNGPRRVGLVYSDQRGVIRVNVDQNRLNSSGAELYDTEGSVPATLVIAARCLIQHGPPYPADLRSLSRPGGCLAAGGTWTAQQDYLRGNGYVLTYLAKDNDKAGAHGFQINARPDPYGRWGLRSFYVDDSTVVRATPEDRPANAQDPPVH
ncbi:MAG TPA: hypothetical protein VK699_03155 [Terriglobales bacterium]|nr:hypothetical protein [Terriglobales bacterium]